MIGSKFLLREDQIANDDLEEIHIRHSFESPLVWIVSSLLNYSTNPTSVKCDGPCWALSKRPCSSSYIKEAIQSRQAVWMVNLHYWTAVKSQPAPGDSQFFVMVRVM